MTKARVLVAVSRRDKEKAKSLDALAKFAYASGGGAPTPPKPTPPAPRPAPPAKAKPPTAPKPAENPYAVTAAERARRAQAAERKAKLEEERVLKQRRANELARGSNLQWRGSGFTDIPASIRRTGFDRVEPTVAQKLHDILGDVKEKDSRVKHREKGRRQGG